MPPAAAKRPIAILVHMKIAYLGHGIIVHLPRKREKRSKKKKTRLRIYIYK
jgi:hypothetical protein